MASFVPGRAVPLQRPVLPRGAGRPVVVKRQGVQRRFPVPPVVVRRVDGSAGRRPTPDRQQSAGVLAVYAYRSVLAGAVGKSVRQVSTEPSKTTVYIIYYNTCKKGKRKVK